MTRTFLPIGALVLLLLHTATLLAQTANRTAGCPPLLVDFTPPSGQSSFFWTFGNGATSTDANPSTTFTEAGTFIVELRESSDGPIVGSLTIEVYPRPTLMATPSLTQGGAPLAVEFVQTGDIDPNIPVSDLRWVFGDGNFSTAAQPTHVYNRPGTYDVSLGLQSSLPGCSTTEIFPQLVDVGGIERLNFFTSPNPPISCTAPFTVNFVNLSTAPNLSFSWDLGNGTMFDGIAPGSVTYEDSGSFRVELTAQDTFGCTNTTSQTVFVLDLASGLNFPDTVCFESPVYYEEFTGQADSVEWDFPSSVMLGRDDLGVRFARFTEPGWQEVGVRASVSGPLNCVLDTTLRVYVEQLMMTLSAAPNFTCQNELTVDFEAGGIPDGMYSWAFDQDMGVDTGATVQFTYEYVDTLEYSQNGLTPYFTVLIGTAPSGCKDTIIRADTIFVPNALFMGDVVNGCAPLTVTFADSSSSFTPILEYVYDYGDGTGATFTTDQDHQHTYTEAGEYPVTLHIRNAAGCRDTSYTRIIEVGVPLETEVLFSPDIICPGEAFSITLNPPLPEADWLQIVGDSLQIEYNGCYSAVPVDPPTLLGPGAAIAYELDCDSPYIVDFESELFDVGSFVWDFGDETTSTERNPTHRYAETGDYLVTLTVEQTDGICPTAVFSQLICIRDIKADFELPDNLCAGTTLDVDASATRDVNGEFCAYGFTWFFDLNGRPIMGNDTILSKEFSTPGREQVTLVAEDVNGCRDTISKFMRIKG